jgi:acyl-CoA thioesterase I
VSGSRSRWAFVGLLALGCLVTACLASAREISTSSSVGAAGGSAQSRTWSVVALGDSVPRGTNCGCTPYPALTAEWLATHTGETVKATNDSVAGATTSLVLGQLDRSDVSAHLRAADVVEIEIGANDVSYSQLCGVRTACYASRIPTVRTNIATIVARVRKLTVGHRVLIVLLDYWSVWLGGQYAAAQGTAYVSAAEQMTDEVNTVIKSTAAASGSAYLDLRAAFKGPSYTWDETRYLAGDGDHPNKAGHKRIATATHAIFKRALHI